ncbi:hypothetical protein C9374_013349 [Naegleria lovaniensis]|uniref:non-specific serine/threonine protein kinase n=1 Tax=Naegleria lovaniensis TaxID=51637 RepID=A0AA88H157_NAELO|nr:uncharacterized protein C9374_013349 [Naegleria lovaniensis]KAG2391864.1 hypothetical protein C9374_013349 [Naegleria lovaniensis]
MRTKKPLFNHINERVFTRLMIYLILIIYSSSSSTIISSFGVRAAGEVEVAYQVSNVMTNLENTLYGAVVHPDGDYLISVLGYVYKINQITLVRTVFTGTGVQGAAVNNVAASLAQYNNPTQLSMGTNYVYIADSYNYVVRQYDLGTNMVSFVYQDSPIADRGLHGVAAAKDDSVVYICDEGRGQVIKWTRQTSTSVVVANGLFRPLGLTLTPEGDLFIADVYNHVIQKLFSNGTMIVFAGTVGQSGYSGDKGPATSARLTYPQGVTYNSASKEVYIVDRHNHAIRKVDVHGIITTIAGNGTAGAPGYLDVTQALFNYPVDMSFHGSKPEFLITDTLNKVLRRLIITCVDSTSYVLSSDFSTCLPLCYKKRNVDPTVCSGNGTCIGPNQCNCNWGYYSSECALYNCYGVIFNDTRVCSGRGQCYKPDNCSCIPNYSGNNCETFYCYGVVNSNTASVCSGHGTCSSHNNCTCNPGYYGNNCEMHDCNGIPFNSPSVCNGNGTCTAPNTCSCKTGYSGTNCDLYYCDNILFNSSSVCNGRGNCISPNNCTCNSSEYFGQYCENFNCFGIVKTDTNTVCSGNGTCTAPNVCSCKTGPTSQTKYYGNQCQYHSCNGIPSNSTNVCYSFGSCVAPDVCVCQPGRNGTFCDNPVCFGIPADDTQKVCSGRGTCSATDKCNCNTGYGGEYCQYPICFGLLSNNSEVCSKHGTCTGPNACQCNLGYDIDKSTCNVTSCFGFQSTDISVCSSQGKCYELDKCTCFDGFVGNTCQYHGVQLDGSTSVIYSSKKTLTSLAPSISSKSCLELFPEDYSLLGNPNNVECKWDASEFKIYLGYGNKIDNMNLLRLTPYNITLQVDTTAANTQRQTSQNAITLDLALTSYPSGLDIIVRASSKNTYQAFRNVSLSWMCYSSDSSTPVSTPCVTSVQNYLSNLADKPIIIIPSRLFTELSGSVYYRQLPLAIEGKNGLATAFTTRFYSILYARVTYPSYNILSDTTIVDQNRFLDCVGESCILEVAPNGASSLMSYAYLGVFATLSSSYEKAQMIRIVNYQPSTASVFDSSYSGELLVIGVATVPTISSIKLSYKAYDKINLVMTNLEKSYSQESNITIGVKIIDPYISNFTPATSTFTYQWSVKDVLINADVISQTSTSPSLRIPAGFLNPGDYTVALSLVIAGDGSNNNDNRNVTGTFVGTFTVLNSSISIPNINIEPIPAISPYGRNLVLTASIASQSACNVTWTLQSGSLRLTSNLLSGNSSNSSFITENTVNEAIYGTNNVVSKLIIPAAYLQAETTYTFAVTASNQDGTSYARVSTRMDAKPRFYCEIYDPSSKMIAYESQFVIHCIHNVESVSSYLMEVFSNSNNKRMVVLSNTPKRWVITRLPYAPNGITISVTLINTSGSIAKLQQSLSLNLPSTLAQDSSLTNTLNYVRYSFNNWRGNETLRMDSAVTVSSLFSLLEYSVNQQAAGSITKATSDALASLLMDMISVLNGIPELGVNVDEKILQLVLSPLRNVFTMLYSQSPSSIDAQLTNIYNWLNYFLNAAGKHSDQFCSTAIKSLLLDTNQVTEIVDLFGIWSTKSVEFTKLLASIATLARNVNAMSGNSSTPSSIPLQLSGGQALFESVSQLNQLNGKKISLSKALIEFPPNFASQMSQNGMASSVSVDILSSVNTASDEKSILSPIISLSLLSKDGSSVVSVKGLSMSSPIYLHFNGASFMQNTSSMGTSLNLTCFYYDSVSSQWKYDGLTSNFTILKNDSGLITYNLMCATTHLTSFSVMNIPQPAQSQRAPSPTIDNSGIIAAIVVPILLVLIFVVILVVIGVVIFIVYRRKKTQSELESVPTSRTIQIELGNETGLDASFFPSDESVNFKPLSQGSSVGSSGTGFDPMSRYKNFIRIGQGAFGSVFKAEDTRNNKMKALKVIKFTNMEELNTMMKEGTQLMNVEHPNILKVNDFFVDKGNILVIDMDFYEHGDLSKLTAAEFHCSEKIIKQVIYQMCDALDYIHCRMKLIHRDVKPSNIFIKDLDEEFIQIVLADFGLAKAQSNNSMNNSYAGTPLFMSPELGLGGKYYANTDIYSLGVAIYQIMTKDTFTSISNIYMAKEPAAVKEWLRSKLQEGQEYSAQLIDITLSMLEKDNLSRPQAQDILNNPYFDDQRRKRKKK